MMPIMKIRFKLHLTLAAITCSPLRKSAKRWLERAMTNHGGMEGLSSASRKKRFFLMYDPAYSKVQMEQVVQSVIFRKGKTVGYGSHTDCCGSRYINQISPLPLPIAIAHCPLPSIIGLLCLIPHMATDILIIQWRG